MPALVYSDPNSEPLLFTLRSVGLLLAVYLVHAAAVLAFSAEEHPGLLHLLKRYQFLAPLRGRWLRYLLAFLALLCAFSLSVAAIVAA